MIAVLNQHVAEHFTGYHADNIEVTAGIPDDSLDLTITSPPFASMYAFSNSDRDLGNTTGIGQMLDHFRFLVRGLLRATKPGRSCCIHLTNINAFMHRDGYVGRFDFRGDLIRLFQSEGWAYAAEVMIDKCPQMRRARTNDPGLLFKNLVGDSSVLSPVMADYLVVFRKKGKNADPIRAGKAKRYEGSNGWVTDDEWIDLAQAVWGFAELGMDDYELAHDTTRGIWYRYKKGERDAEHAIRETDVLNARLAKDSDDERHLCPLQLGVIRNCVRLWSSPGDVVYDPFGGIGSTPHEAIRLRRKGLFAELKESYYRQAVRNCQRAVRSLPSQRSFLDDLATLELATAGGAADA